MVAMVVLVLGAAAYVSVAGVRRSLPVYVVAAEGAPALLQGVPVLRARYGKPSPYSVGSFLWLLITVSASIVWNLAVIILSGLSGWWAHGQALTFDISVGVGLVPLAFGIWQVSSRIRAVER